MADRVADAIAGVSAEETARIISTVIRMTGDFALAEDCAQDAFARALTDWRKGGIPDNPGAWLTTVAKRRAIDLLRHASAEDRALRWVAVEAYERVEPDPDAHGDMDDRLRLIFTCCHPALSMDDRVALTLRMVAGLTPAQIAGVFLVTEPAMNKRLVRARAKIKHAGIPYRVPPPHLMPERRDGVLAVLYLLFTEGYSATGGDALIRVPLLREAIRLTRLLVELMPDDGEVLALPALMLLHHARTAARTDAVADVITLEEQDRSLWDRDAITEALTILRSLVPRAGRYGPQAHIAPCHLEASDAAITNFAHIAELYDALAVIDPSPLVELNRAVAAAMSQGPEVGLALIDALVTSRGMGDYYLLPATRADLLRRMGRSTEAATEYERALQQAPSEAEKRYFGKRLAETRRR